VKTDVMKDRLQKLMIAEKLVPAKFAEIIGVQRSSVSHILSGRNKPSYDVIHSILIKFPKINPDWLLTGAGEIYRKPVQTSIFDQMQPAETQKSIEIHSQNQENKIISKQTTSQEIPKALKNAINGRKIERVVVFYNDKTFSEYLPDE
jgi:transcriptional regulator with XRE-family HTH domain